MPHRRALALLLTALACHIAPAHAQRTGEQVDVSEEFHNRDSVYFVPDSVKEIDPATGVGVLRWNRYALRSNLSFNKVDGAFALAESNEFPATEYDRNPGLPFEVTFISPRTVRLRFATRNWPLGDGASLMLAGPMKRSEDWRHEDAQDAITFTSPKAKLRIQKNPWRIELYDAKGQLVTRTRTLKDPDTFSAPTPFCFVRRTRDLGYSTAASFDLAPDEKIFGCGESFTRFNKRGQKVILYTRDGMGVQTQKMYKPIPFFLSSRGYGMFVHTSTPVTCDFGQEFDAAATIYTGDETLDLFLFVGDPKEVLTEYTAVTGRSPPPPLWSFGLWMSRITYKSEQEVRQVAAHLRKDQIPCDVIHLDTGWFETDWRCNYKFAPSRFDDPQKMIADLRDDGFHISLWQLPYFTSKNELFDTIVKEGYEVKNEGGQGPYLDAILDFSNPSTVKWYQGLLANLLKLGVGAIKVDFGEDAPLGWRLCFRSHRLVRAQPLSPALQQSRRRDYEANHRRQHHLGSQRLGRQPALPAPLGRRRRKHRQRHGRHASRRPVLRPLRIQLLEPRCWRLCRPAVARPLSPLARVRRAHQSHPLPRRPAPRTLAVRRRVRERLPPRHRAEVFAHALHLHASQALLQGRPPDAPPAFLRVPSRSGFLAH